MKLKVFNLKDCPLLEIIPPTFYLKKKKALDKNVSETELL